MGIDILIVNTPMDRLNKLANLFEGHCYRFPSTSKTILIKQTLTFNDTSTYANLSEDDLATLEFLPDFDTRYTYLLSLSLGIDA